MSCFGHVVVLPNGELAEAAAAAVETAAGAAEVVEAAKELDQAASKPDEKAQPDDKAKSKPKEKAKADEKRGRRRCIPLGATEGTGLYKQYSKPGIWVKCEYRCGKEVVKITLDPGCYEDCKAEANIPFW